jgi:hypothetical protein
MEVTDALSIIINQLEGGRTLNTLGFLHQDGLQYENGELFSSGRAQALERHRSFRSGVTGFRGQHLASRIEGSTSYLHVQYEYRDAAGQPHNLPGVHVLQWRDGLITREDFWVDEMYEVNRAEYFGNEPN